MTFPTLYIGSNIQSNLGIGTLLKWKHEELEDIHFDAENGWVVVNKRGNKFFCYDLMRVETSLGGDIETTELFADEFKFNKEGSES